VVSDDTLNEFRLDGVLVRVVRDACEENDVEGMVVAWSDTHVLIRKKKPQSRPPVQGVFVPAGARREKMAGVRLSRFSQIRS